MAFFGVTIEEIEAISPIEGADMIEMAKLKGLTFEFVVAKKDSWNTGMKCLYFPIDSLLPEWLLEKIGLVGRLSGKNKNRVKTVKLRGQISQGIVTELNLLEGILTPVMDLDKDTQSLKITEFLGVEKYEPPAIPCHTAQLIRLPVGLSVFDIEGADRYVEVAEELMPQRVEITEKLEGQNFSVTYSVSENKIYVNQRKYSILPIEGYIHEFWSVAEKKGIINLVESLKESYPGKDITVYGEFIGPGTQSNIYKLRDFDVKLFDIKINEEWLTPAIRHAVIKNYFGNLDVHVPVLESNIILKDWLDGKSFVEASHGISRLHNTTREGIVIKPMTESRHKKIGRLIIKQRDPIYLAKTNN